MNRPLMLAFFLADLVSVAGVLLWVFTGRPVFAVFVVLGVVTAVGAVLTARSISKQSAAQSGIGGTS